VTLVDLFLTNIHSERQNNDDVALEG